MLGRTPQLLLAAITTSLWVFSNGATTAEHITVHILNIFPSPEKAAVIYNGNSLFDISYRETVLATVPVNASLQIVHGKGKRARRERYARHKLSVFTLVERVNVTRRLQSEGAIVISQNRLGDLQADLIQPDDRLIGVSQSDQIQLAFYNAIKDNDFDCFAVNSRTRKMLQFGKGVPANGYSLTIAPAGDYEFKIFAKNRIHHINDFKNVRPKTKAIRGNFSPKSPLHLAVLFRDGSNSLVHLEVVPQPDPPRNPDNGPKLEVIIMNAVRSDGKIEVKLNSKISKLLSYGQSTVAHVYVEKGQTATVHHGRLGSCNATVKNDVPYEEGKCFLLAEVVGSTMHCHFDCWQNRNISISHNTTWLFIYNALARCGKAEVVAYGTRSNCTGHCEEFLLLSYDLADGFANHAAFLPGLYHIKGFPAGSIANLEDFYNISGLTPDVFVNFKPGETYFSSLIGQCESDKYPPRYVLHQQTPVAAVTTPPPPSSATERASTITIKASSTLSYSPTSNALVSSAHSKAVLLAVGLAVIVT